MKLKPLAFGLAIAGASCAQASEYSLDLGLRLKHSDNVSRSQANERSELEQAIDTTIRYSTSTPFVNAQLKYQAQFETYNQDTHDDEWYLDGSAQVQVNLLPQRLQWVFNHSQRTQTIDSFGSDSPNNLDERSQFQTGPVLNFDVTGVDQLKFSAFYIDTRYDKSDFQDSERNVGQVAWEHRTSQIGVFSLKASVSDVEFLNHDFTYDNTSYGLEYQRKLKYGNFKAEVGNNEVERSNGANFDGIYSKASLNIELVESELAFRYLKELTDTSAGLGLSGSLSDNLGTGDEELGLIDVIERETAQAFYTFKGNEPESRLTFGVFQNRDLYQTANRDDQRRGIFVNHHHQFSNEWSSQLAVRFTETDRTSVIDSFNEGLNETTRTSLYFVYRYSPQFRVRFGLQHTQRDNSDNTSREYDELEGLIGVYYRFGQD